MLPLERSVSGLALACTPAIWYEWLELALRLRAEHQYALSSGQGLWQMSGHTLSSAQLLYPWLMNLVLQRRNAQVRALNPFHRHALLGNARSLLPLAVQAAALKGAYHQSGQRHYLQAFEQLCRHQGLQGEGRRVSKLVQAVAPQTPA